MLYQIKEVILESTVTVVTTESAFKESSLVYLLLFGYMMQTYSFEE